MALFLASDGASYVNGQALAVDGEAIATYGGDLVTADLLDQGAERPSHDTSRLGEVLRGLTET